MAEYGYSSILKGIKKKIENDFETEISDIDFNNIAKKALRNKGIDLGSLVDINPDILADIMGEAVSEALKNGDWKSKIKRQHIDISDLLDLDERKLNKQINDYYKEIQEAFDEGGEKLEKAQKNFMRAMITSNQKKEWIAGSLDEKEFEHKLKKMTDSLQQALAIGDKDEAERVRRSIRVANNKREWASEYQALLTETKVDARRNDTVLSDELTDSAKEYQKMLIDISRTVKESNSQMATETIKDIGKQQEKVKKTFKDFIGQDKLEVVDEKTVRNLSDIGLTVDQMREKLRLEAEEIKKGNMAYKERITLLKDGKVVDSFIGEKDKVGIKTSKQFDTLFHTHPDNEPGSYNFGNNDVKFFGDDKKAFSIFRKAELITNGITQVVMDFANMTEDQIREFSEMYDDAEHTVRAAFGKMQENGLVDLHDANFEEVSKYLNALGSFFMKDFGGAVKYFQSGAIDPNKFKQIYDAYLQAHELFQAVWENSPDDDTEAKARKVVIKDMYDNFHNTVDKETKDMENTAKEDAVKVKEAAKKSVETIKAAVDEGIAEATDSHSPSVEAGKQMDNVIDGFVEEAEQRLPEVEQAGEKIGEAVKSGIKESTADVSDDMEAYLAQMDQKVAPTLNLDVKETTEDMREVQEEAEKTNAVIEEQKQKIAELEKANEGLHQTILSQGDELQHAYEEQGSIQLDLDSAKSIAKVLEDELSEQKQITAQLQEQNEQTKARNEELEASVEKEKELRKEAESNAAFYKEMSHTAAYAQAQAEEKERQAVESQYALEKELQLQKEINEQFKEQANVTKIYDTLNENISQLVERFKELRDTLDKTVDQLKEMYDIYTKLGGVDIKSNQLSALNNISDAQLNKLVEAIKGIQATQKATSSQDVNLSDFIELTDKNGKPMKIYRGVSSVYSGYGSNRYHGGTFSTNDRDLAVQYTQRYGNGKIYEADAILGKHILEIMGNKHNWDDITFTGNGENEASKAAKKALEGWKSFNKDLFDITNIIIDEIKDPDSYGEFKNIDFKSLMGDKTHLYEAFDKFYTSFGEAYQDVIERFKSGALSNDELLKHYVDLDYEDPEGEDFHVMDALTGELFESIDDFVLRFYQDATGTIMRATVQKLKNQLESPEAEFYDQKEVDDIQKQIDQLESISWREYDIGIAPGDFDDKREFLIALARKQFEAIAETIDKTQLESIALKEQWEDIVADKNSLYGHGDTNYFVEKAFNNGFDTLIFRDVYDGLSYANDLFVTKYQEQFKNLKSTPIQQDYFEGVLDDYYNKLYELLVKRRDAIIRHDVGMREKAEDRLVNDFDLWPELLKDLDTEAMSKNATDEQLKDFVLTLAHQKDLTKEQIDVLVERFREAASYEKDALIKILPELDQFREELRGDLWNPAGFTFDDVKPFAKGIKEEFIDAFNNIGSDLDVDLWSKLIHSAFPSIDEEAARSMNTFKSMWAWNLNDENELDNYATALMRELNGILNTQNVKQQLYDQLLPQSPVIIEDKVDYEPSEEAQRLAAYANGITEADIEMQNQKAESIERQNKLLSDQLEITENITKEIQTQQAATESDKDSNNELITRLQLYEAITAEIQKQNDLLNAQKNEDAQTRLENESSFGEKFEQANQQIKELQTSLDEANQKYEEMRVKAEASADNESVKKLQDELDTLKAQYAELGKTMGKKSVKAGTKEAEDFNKLKDVLDEITNAIKAKTEAFKEEQKVVKDVVKSEVGDVQQLKGAVDAVKQAKKEKKQQEQNKELDNERKVVRYYERLQKNEARYQELKVKQDAGYNLTKSEMGTLGTLQRERDLEDEILKTVVKRSEAVERARQGYLAISEFERENRYNALTSSVKNDITAGIEKLQGKIDTGKFTDSSVAGIVAGLERIRSGNYLDENNIVQLRDYVAQLDNLDAALVKAGNHTKLVKLLGDVNSTINENSRMSNDLRTNFRDLGEQIQEAINTEASQEQVRALTDRFLELKNEMIESGEEGRSFFDMIVNDIGQASARAIAQYASFQDWMNYIGNAVDSVTELDSALTQLKIISGQSDAALNNLAKSAYELGNNLGMATTEVLSSITEWKRLGYTVEESMILAEQAARLSTGGMMDISSATTALVSSMQAFEMKADEVNKVVDQYIYLGKGIAHDKLYRLKPGDGSDRGKTICSLLSS